jgi:hypothetical protein
LPKSSGRKLLNFTGGEYHEQRWIEGAWQTLQGYLPAKLNRIEYEKAVKLAIETGHKQAVTVVNKVIELQGSQHRAISPPVLNVVSNQQTEDDPNGTTDTESEKVQVASEAEPSLATNLKGTIDPGTRWRRSAYKEKGGIENLFKAYQGKESRPGQFVALFGPKGSGKNLLQERILLSHKLPLVGGVYAGRFKRSPLTIQPDLAPRHQNDQRVSEVLREGKSAGSLQAVDWVAAGLMLVHRKVFERIRDTQPWDPPFAGAYYPYFTQTPTMGEDITFCQRARKAGAQPMLDTEVRAGHIGTCCFLPEDSQPAIPLRGSRANGAAPPQSRLLPLMAVRTSWMLLNPVTELI